MDFHPFFIQDNYGFENRGVGIQEYKNTVKWAATNPDDTAFFSWAKEIIEKKFSVSNLL